MIEHFPKELAVLYGCEPVYEEMPGWSESTVGVRDADRLPGNAKKYIARVADLLKTRIRIVSTGQKRDEIIIMK